MNFHLQVEIKKQFGTQWRFAQAVGVHESMVSKVLRGIRPLSDDEKRAWAKTLRRKKDDLFGGPE